MGAHGASVLIVDFNVSYTNELKSALTNQNIQVACCKTEEQAIQILGRSVIELVVLGPLLPLQTVQILNRIRQCVPKPVVIFSTNVTSILAPQNQHERVSSEQIASTIESRLNEIASIHTFSGHQNEYQKKEISSISSPIVSIKNELNKLRDCLPKSRDSESALEEARDCSKSISQISKSQHWLGLQQTASTLEMTLSSFVRQPALKGPEAWALVDESLIRLESTFKSFFEKYKSSEKHSRRLLHSDVPPPIQTPSILVISKEYDFCERFISLGRNSQLAVYTSTFEEAFKHLNLLTFDAIFIDQKLNQLIHNYLLLTQNSKLNNNLPIFTVTSSSTDSVNFPPLKDAQNLSWQQISDGRAFSNLIESCQQRKKQNAKKILLLQEDNQVAKYLSDITQHYGIEISNTSNPLSLLDNAEKILPDLFVIDISSRTFDAKDLCSLIRSNPLFKNKPLLFLGQPASKLTHKLCNRYKNTDFINKPISEQEIISRMWVLSNQNTQPFSLKSKPTPQLHDSTQLSKVHTEVNDTTTNQFEKLLENIGVEVQVIGTDGIFKQITANLFTPLEFSAEELVGQTFLSFVHPDDQPKTISAFTKIHKQKKPFNFEIRLRSKSGKFVWFSWNGAFHQNQFYGTVQNITEKKQMQMGLEQLFYMSPFMICMLDNRGCFAKINPSFMTVLGYTQGELIGKSLKNFLHTEDVSFFESLFSHLQESKTTTSFQNRFRKSDGAFCWLYWKASYITETNTLYAMAKDITESKNKITIPPHIESSASLQESLQAIRKSLTQILQAQKSLLPSGVHNLVQDALQQSEHLSGSIENPFLGENKKKDDDKKDDLPPHLKIVRSA